jgi:hypothetical protein
MSAAAGRFTSLDIVGNTASTGIKDVFGAFTIC